MNILKKQMKLLQVQADCHVLAEWSERQSVALLHSEKMRQNP